MTGLDANTLITRLEKAGERSDALQKGVSFIHTITSQGVLVEARLRLPDGRVKVVTETITINRVATETDDPLVAIGRRLFTELKQAEKVE